MLAREFQAFSGTHALCVAVSIAGWWALLAAARRARPRDGARKILRATGWTIVASAAASTAIECLPGFWNKDSSLPLHLCDFAWFAAGAALVSSRRIFQALAFYWGFGLSSEAFFTPTLKYGPATFDFWSFWICHWQILAGALLVVAVRGWRPAWRDFAVVVIATAALVAAVTAVNLALETNYCFTGRSTPSAPTILDVLGPWPGRLGTLAAAVLGLFAAMTWPFARRPAPSVGDARGRRLEPRDLPGESRAHAPEK